MPRSKTERTFTQVSAHLNDDDLAVLLTIMRTAGHGTPESAIRTALWNYGRHLGVDVPVDAFKLR